MYTVQYIWTGYRDAFESASLATPIKQFRHKLNGKLYEGDIDIFKPSTPSNCYYSLF